jgi:hypothetical protein
MRIIKKREKHLKLFKFAALDLQKAYAPVQSPGFLGVSPGGCIKERNKFKFLSLM